MNPRIIIDALLNPKLTSAFFGVVTATSLMACAIAAAPASETAEADISAATKCSGGKVFRPIHGKKQGACQEPGKSSAALCYLTLLGQCENLDQAGNARCVATQQSADGPTNVGLCDLFYTQQGEGDPTHSGRGPNRAMPIP
jgi:hypothetical protein